MHTNLISEILGKIRNIQVAVYGDFCLDAYWIMDPAGSEISVETGLRAEAVRKHYYSPGGAANIIANLAALKPAGIRVIGVIGDDILGRELTAQLKALRADTSGLVVQDLSFDTYAFVKKYMDEEEEPRIDFGVFNNRTAETDEAILTSLRKALEETDVLIFNQQVPGSISRPEFFEAVNRLFNGYRERNILLDSRHFNDRFSNAILKTNEIEIARMNGVRIDPGMQIPLTEIREYGKKIFSKWNKPLFITCGERGLIAIDEKGTHEIPGIQFLKRLDTVGAGDTTISALALCLAAGIDSAEAARFACLAASVTVQKLFTTGTASGDEILKMSLDPDYIYNPDLADDPGQATFAPGSRIEICEKGFGAGRTRIRAAIFDHDGTISTLRHGWETVMETYMSQMITGSRRERISEKLLARIRSRVKEYIEKSTGIQTIRQMKALGEMVREFNLVPAGEQPDDAGYKRGYLEALMKSVNKRLQEVKQDRTLADKYIVAGAVDFLHYLGSKGIRLYLASGTDRPDVINEAQILGYAGLFDGGIYGSVDDLKRYSKKLVMKKIMDDNDIPGEELVVFGDGPVEIREARKISGLAGGLATDESESGSLNPEKRNRLVKAGAHLIIPDFSEWQKLAGLINC